MDELKEPNPEVDRIEEVISTAEEIIQAEAVKTKHAGGAPSVMMRPELLADYMRIHHLTSVGNYMPNQIVEYFAKEGKIISTDKVRYACKWVRDRWPILEEREKLVDAENVVMTRIREYTTMIEKAKIGEPVFRLDGEPLLDKMGNQVMKVDKEFVRVTMKDRAVQERLLMELRGSLRNAQTVITNTAILGDAHMEMTKKLTLFEIMEEPDRLKYLEIFDKYGKIEPEEAPS